MINHEKLTVKQLRKLAKDKGLKGYSRVKKDELVYMVTHNKSIANFKDGRYKRNK